MTSIRLIRPPTDNKIRSFSRAGSCNDVLHSTNFKRKINPTAPFDAFISSVGKKRNNAQTNTVYRSYQDLVVNSNGNNNSRHDICTTRPLEQSGAVDTSRTGSETEKVFMRMNKNVIVVGQRKHSPANNERKKGDIANPVPGSSQSPTFTSRGGNGNNNSPSHKLKDSVPGNLPLAGYPVDANCVEADTQYSTKFPPHQTAACYSDTRLFDVNDDEVGQLPELGTPSRFIRQASKNEFYKFLQDDAQETGSMKSKMPKLKRSLSSFETDEDYTSFFGSISNRGKRKTDEEAEEECDRPVYFNAYVSKMAWQSTSATSHLGLNLNRAYSAESFMRKDARSDIHSRRSSSYGGNEIYGGDFLLNKDRLQMRRGALAQPEKMLISQKIRERAQKDVEKRKTSLIRKVSQFFNVHLRLNREEDLI